MDSEVYRSFEGKLDADSRSGYIIYDGGKWWQIEHLSVWRDVKKALYRIDKNFLSLSDFQDAEKIAKIEIDIDQGNYSSPNMQILYKDKWYSSPTIRKIQTEYQDYNWEKYV